MKRTLFLRSLLFLVFTSTSIFAQNKPFWNEIQAFKKQDSISMPAKGGIVFVGSSSFRMWKDLETVYKDYNAINRGFGGSTLVHANLYAEDLVIKYQPRQVVIYSGENDIAEGSSAIETFENLVEFFTTIRNKIPNVPVAYVSMKQSPSRTKFSDAVVHANALIKEYLSHYKNTSFIDVDGKMLTSKGALRPELFQQDMLHMKPAGYAIWTEQITPYLIKK